MEIILGVLVLFLTMAVAVLADIVKQNERVLDDVERTLRDHVRFHDARDQDI